MSDAKHTPEPWTFNATEKGFDICAVSPGDSEANAARIVACVNACAGINPEAIPDLVATLNSIIEWWEDDHDFPYQGAKVDPGEACQWYKRRMYLMAEAARAALAKAKGGES